MKVALSSHTKSGYENPLILNPAMKTHG